MDSESSGYPLPHAPSGIATKDWPGPSAGAGTIIDSTAWMHSIRACSSTPKDPA